MAAGSTYTPIATTTLGSNANSVTFSSISGSYTDLVIVFGNLGASSSQTIYVQPNSDTSTNYSWTVMNGEGSVAQSIRASNSSTGLVLGGSIGGVPSSTNAMGTMSIQNYSNTTTFKSSLSRYSAGSVETQAAVALWRSTAAISSLKIYITSGANILAGATFTLYGITAA